MIRLIALAFMCLSVSAYAQDKPSTPPVDDFKCIADAKETIAKVGKAIADDSEDDMRLFSGLQATAILKTINESPPPTHYKGDALMVLIHHSVAEEPVMGRGEGGGSVLIFLISDECITGSLPKLPAGAWGAILHEAIGDEA